MVSASALRAKLAGLMVEKVEVGNPGDFSGCETVQAVVNKILAGPGGPIEQYYPVDEQDRQGLLDLIERHHIELEDYIAAIRARPLVVTRCDPDDLTTPWNTLELRPLLDTERKYREHCRQREICNQRLLPRSPS